MSDFDPIRLRGAADGGEAEVCAHGAHVLRWSPRGAEPALFVSRASRFAVGEPIRGGVPVIFPWFGDDPQGLGRAAHGFARRRAWRRVAGGDRACAVFELADDAATLALWPHRFLLRLTVVVDAGLQIALQTTNVGAEEFRFENALHSYFAVGDIRRTTVRGLAGARFTDKLSGASAVQGEAPITFAAETDQVFAGTSATCVIDDRALGRRITVAKTGSRSTIVWNPWIGKAARMADFGDDEWPQMLCVESGNVGADAITLAPGASHTMTVRLDVTALD